MLSSLNGQKMSKSDPNSAIFMEDPVELVNKKIKIAWCPERVDKDENDNKNPILDYCENIIFAKKDTFFVDRKPENGGPVKYHSYDQLYTDFMAGNLHPADLKPNVAREINEMLEPVRQHFANDQYAKGLLEQITKWQAEALAKKAQQK